jgi:hypothetical protein
MAEEKPTVGPGFKFPVLYEVTRPVENSEKVPGIDGTMTEISNLRGHLFWAKPAPEGKEMVVCLESIQARGWLDQNAALVSLIESLPPYA